MAQSKKSYLIITAITIALLITVSALTADIVFFKDKIPGGVKVGGFDLGLMTRNEASRFLRSKTLLLLDKPISIDIDGTVCPATAKSLGASFLYDKAVGDAYKLSRGSNFLSRSARRISLWLAPASLPLPVRVDAGVFKDFYAASMDVTGFNPVNYSIKIDKGQPVIVDGAAGKEVDTGRLSRLLEISLLQHPKEDAVLVLPFTKKQPDIDYAGALKAFEKVQTLLSSPIVLKTPKNTEIEAPVDVLAGFIDIVEQPEKGTIGVSLKSEVIKAWLEPLLADMTSPPVNASFEIKGEEVNVIPSQNGTGLNMAETVKQIEKAGNSASGRRAFVILDSIIPELTTEKAKGMGINKRISTYTTYYNPGEASRVHNIHLLASFLDGIILAPNEKFSFNDKLGPRTAQRGFREAPMILDGELVPALGGGICQVGTTLFNSVFLSGLDIVERHNHSFYISHYPKGRDATVSFGSVDLKFLNDSGKHVLLKSQTTPSSLTISLYGTDFGAVVTYSSSKFTNFKPYDRKDVPDPELDTGVEKVFSGGISGRDITVKRTVKIGDKVVHDDTFFSRYSPKKQIVHVGIRPVAEPVPAPPQTTSNTIPAADVVIPVR